MSNHDATSEVKLVRVPAPDFDLEKTLNSGQAFHWEKSDDGGFIGAIADVPMRVRQSGAVLRVWFDEREVERLNRSSSAAAASPRQLVEHYFALDHPLAEICAALPD